MSTRTELRRRTRHPLVLLVLASACTEAPVPPAITTCPAGTVRQDRTCIPEGARDGGDLLPVAPEAGVVEPTDAGPRADATATGADAGGATALPFFIDDHYVMSGYMGGGEVTTVPCEAGTGSRGTCRRITWTPGGAPWVGFYFQYPANNWTLPGLAIAPGARRVRFRAWGATGTESMNFATGIRAVDGFQVESGYTRLGTTPTARELSLDGVSYSQVAGAFAWFIENPAGATSVTIYLDDIEWTDAAAAGADASVAPDASAADSGVHPDASTTSGDASVAVTLPLWLDDYYVMSGFMGSGNVQTEACATDPGDPASPCRRITWTPGGAEWAGFYFQYPANNWTMPGLRIPPGAQRVSFYVWGPTGTESLNFAAGINAVDGFQLESGYGVVTTQRTLHTIDLRAARYPNGVAGAFAWFVNNPARAATVTFFLDDVRWE